MNKACFRQIFDTVRGMLVGLGEQTVSLRKGVTLGTHRACRAGACVDRRGRFGKRSAARFTAHPIALAVWCVCGVQSSTVGAQTTLPISPADSATAIGVTANHLPLVHIAKPNPAGVSHSRFTDYNVGTGGVVLNNSGTPSLTQSDGLVRGNPFLGNGHARIILVEVTSGNPSRLLGMTEVAGRGANVVVANPAGIYCNGCGFINAPRATLVTGVPVLNELGALTGLTVMQGALTVDGKGLDSHGSSQLDLIARAMRINGQIRAGQLINAIAGENRVDYAMGTVSAANGSGVGAPPVVAIDVAALGGMYANVVRLVSTEHGVGVNLEGMVNSLTGDIHVSSNGDVTIARDGALSAAKDARIDAASIRNAGALAANGAAMLIASNDIDNSDGVVTALGNVDVRGRDVRNDDGTIKSVHGALTATAQHALTNEGGKIVGESVMAQAAESLVNIDGQIQSSGVTRIETATLVNEEGDINGSKVRIDAADALKNAEGKVFAQEALDVKAGNVSNFEGRITSSGTATIDSTGELDNREGVLAGTGSTDVHAATLINEGGEIGSANGTLKVRVDDTLSNDDGKLIARDRVDVQAVRFSNQDGIVSGEPVFADAAEIQQ